ncbi:MAG: folate family ECF transporter S component [Bacillota bacterium]|nr:folate family ECF transporter S component [Bacillota bacterium]
MKKMNTKMLVTAGILIALNIILSRFLSINAWNLKIGFTFISVFIAAYFFGPALGAIVAGLGDFLGAILFPIGAYFPGFTFTAVLTGLLYGILLHKKQTPLRVVVAVAADQLILSLLLNTLWISILYGSPFIPLLATRVIQCLVMIPVEFLTISVITKVLVHTRREVLQQ